ncbi:DUF4139 domain-containing protein [Candidatus Sumerlaeota bacterium]|nr:DUF4139 domain-containing protein [Candidatus Sumerlaeota bacterium]
MRTVCLLLVTLTLTAGPMAAVVQSTAEQTEQVFLTVYNSDLGLVREVRTVPLPSGTLDLEYADVAARIDPTTVHITSLSHPGELAVLEQNFEYDLLSPDRLLENFIGRPIRFTSRSNSDPSQAMTREGTLLSVQGGRIIETDDGIVINPEGEISVEADTGALRAEPTLVWLLESGAEAEHRLEASYLTSGISWEADYVAVINNTDTELGLTGWVTIDNRSGATYENARLKLVAGDVNRAQQPPPMPEMMYARGMVTGGAPQFEEETFFEYHLYTLQRPATVRDRQTKQITLLTAEGVEITKRLIAESPWFSAWTRSGGAPGEPEHVRVEIEFDNTEANRMGMPLPRGTVRMYRADSDGALQFIGEDSIDHTPRDEQIRLEVGEAFDVVYERTQLDFRELMGDRTEHDWQITVRNHKEEDVAVTIVEHATGDWAITRESQRHEQVTSDTFEYTVDVPADGEATVTYTIRFDNR